MCERFVAMSAVEAQHSHTLVTLSAYACRVTTLPHPHHTRQPYVYIVSASSGLFTFSDMLRAGGFPLLSDWSDLLVTSTVHNVALRHDGTHK